MPSITDICGIRLFLFIVFIVKIHSVHSIVILSIYHLNFAAKIEIKKIKTMTKYIFELFKKSVCCGGDLTQLMTFAKEHGRTVKQAKEDLKRVNNLLLAVELYINKAIVEPI